MLFRSIQQHTAENSVYLTSNPSTHIEEADHFLISPRDLRPKCTIQTNPNLCFIIHNTKKIRIRDYNIILRDIKRFSHDKFVQPNIQPLIFIAPSSNHKSTFIRTFPHPHLHSLYQIHPIPLNYNLFCKIAEHHLHTPDRLDFYTDGSVTDLTSADVRLGAALHITHPTALSNLYFNFPSNISPSSTKVEGLA